MLVLDVTGLRVVARPDAIDRAIWHDTDTDANTDAEAAADGSGAPLARVPLIFRFAPDEVFAVVGPGSRVELDDPDAIIVEEDGFLGFAFDAEDFVAIVVPHVEWRLPPVGTLGQGSIAGVPAKVDLDPDGGALVLIATAHEFDFRDRLGIHG